MVTSTDKLLVGVSGGADSVCLLFLMHKYCQQNGISLEVVHIHHGIRETANRDMEYVRSLCQSLDVSCHIVMENVPAVALAEKMSSEEAGRKVRYENFERLAGELGTTKVALAHNSNDRAETMLLFLFRGTGLRGLCGIRPCRDFYIRPLLCLSRQEIEEYLQERGIAYCQDETNDEDAYTRNRIRHHILPYAQKEIATGCVENMNRTGEQLALVEDYLQLQLEGYKSRVLETISTGFLFSADVFLQDHELLQRMLVYQCLVALSPGKKDITSRHVEQVLDLFLAQSGKETVLPFGITGRREFGKVVLERISDETRNQMKKEASREQTRDCSEEVLKKLLTGQEIRFNGYRFCARRFPYEPSAEIPQNKYTKWFDCDKIESLVIRSRRPGDFLTIRDKYGSVIHKRVKEYLIGEKVPKSERDFLPLICQGQEIIWVVGHRIGESFKVTEQTKTVIELTAVKER